MKLGSDPNCDLFTFSEKVGFIDKVSLAIASASFFLKTTLKPALSLNFGGRRGGWLFRPFPPFKK